MRYYRHALNIKPKSVEEDTTVDLSKNILLRIQDAAVTNLSSWILIRMVMETWRILSVE